MMILRLNLLRNFASSPNLKPPPPLKKAKVMNSPHMAAKVAKNQKQSGNLAKQAPIVTPPKSNKKVVGLEDVQMQNIIDETRLRTDDKFEPKKKSPVITIMGHVDHGKTTLIDYLRKSDIADKESGGITQKIGAFHIDCHGEKITFIDTPGHEAFTNMRQRGAEMTDLVVLVVSATEGVKKQTKQIIDTILAKNIPTIVAINKLDLPNADPESVEKSVQEAGLDIEPLGGSVPVIHISAKAGTNVSLLSELIIEQTKHLTAVDEGTVEGFVLEAHKNVEGSNCMTMIVQKGTLKFGSILVVGDSWMRVSKMKDDRGNSLSEGKPGDAVEVLNIPIVPKAGSIIYEVKDERRAKFILSKKKEKSAAESERELSKSNAQMGSTKIKINNRRERRAFCRGFSERWIEKYRQTEDRLVEELQNLKRVELTAELMELIIKKEEELINHRKYVEEYLLNTKDKPNTLNLILKFADRGIEETILEQLEGLADKIKKGMEISLNIISHDVGEVTEGDVKNARVSNSEVICFGVGLSSAASNEAAEGSVVVRSHDLIHSFLKEVEEAAMRKKRSSVTGIERGVAEVVEVFNLKRNKKGIMTVAGFRVKSGKLSKRLKFYVFRNGLPISQALSCDFIKKFKTEVAEVRKNDEGTLSLSQGEEGLFEKGDEIYCIEE